MKKYYNRETAPLGWHKLTCFGSLMGGILCVATAIYYFITTIISNNLLSGNVKIVKFISIAVLLACGVLNLYMYYWGRKFKKVFLTVLVVEFAVMSLLDLIIFIFIGMNGQVLFDSVLYYISSVLVFIYYKKRLPLFDPNYTGLEPGQSVEINYNQLKEGKTGILENQ